MVVMAMNVWTLSEMALVKVAVSVERIRSGQSTYEPQYASHRQR